MSDIFSDVKLKRFIRHLSKPEFKNIFFYPKGRIRPKRAGQLMCMRLQTTRLGPLLRKMNHLSGNRKLWKGESSIHVLVLQ